MNPAPNTPPNISTSRATVQFFQAPGWQPEHRRLGGTRRQNRRRLGPDRRPARHHLDRTRRQCAKLHPSFLPPPSVPSDEVGGAPATRANGALQIVAGSHHFPINSEGDQLNEEERQRYAPESKRLHLEMQRGEVVLVRNVSQTPHGPSFAHG